VKSLTARQQEVLNIIKAAIEHTGRPPTRAEIAQQLGFRSANAAEDHLQALAKKGALILDASTSRGIRLAAEHLEAAGTLSERFLDNLLQLPLVGRVAAGSPILAQEHVEANYPVDAALFSEKPDYLLKVRGMSMRDIGILDGDLLAVKKTENAWHGQTPLSNPSPLKMKTTFQLKVWLWVCCASGNWVKPGSANSADTPNTKNQSPWKLKHTLESINC